LPAQPAMITCLQVASTVPVSLAIQYCLIISGV
jgi:hypothetical protein